MCECAWYDAVYCSPCSPLQDTAAPLKRCEFENHDQLLVYPELLLVPSLIGLAIVVGILPAVSAYRTDVAKSLGV